MRIEGLLLIVVLNYLHPCYCSSISHFKISGKVRAILICSVHLSHTFKSRGRFAPS
jgi:hypothetical protein